MSLAPGTRLGPYELIDLMGVGGMGEVYRARDVRLGRDVALKTLPSSFAAAPQPLQRFQRESRALSALSHPNVCQVFDIGCQDGVHFIVMECLEGQTLREIIRSQPLALSSIIQCALQIASALQISHAAGIIHRDIKPANIFITRLGVAKLLDFGLAKFEQSVAPDTLDDQTLTISDLTMRGVPVGTIAYMSPEQARGVPVDSRTDLFSFGAVLYEMAVACRAFPGNSTAEIFAAILHSDPVPPSRLNPVIPKEFDRIVARLVEKAPEARYPDAGELIAALKGLSSSFSSSAEIVLSPSALQPATPTPERLQSLAVLPLLDLSANPSQDYFVDGLTEALISGLARIGGIRVISRTSSMCYKNTRKRVALIGQELSVDAVMEGSVLRSGERLRLICRLIDPRTEECLWTDTFDRSLRDILSLHDDINHAIASGIRDRIQQHSATPIRPPRKNDPEAYDSYLRGRYFWNKRNESSLKKAIECFQHALDLDPLYAPAYTGIADSYFYLGYSFGRMDPSDAMPRARAAALRALELDPHLADAYCSLALVQAHYDWDWDSAESNYRRAIALNPSLSTAHHLYSLLLSAFHRNDESLEHIHTALQSDPLSLPIHNFVGLMYFAVRRYDPAIATLRKTVEMAPGFGLAHSVLGAVLEAKGLNDQAAEEYLTALTVGHHSPEECDAIRSAYLKGGIAGLHEEDLNHCLRRWDGWHGLTFDIGAVYAGTGRITESLDWLERACESRSGRLAWLNSGTAFSRIPQYFDNLRSEPRFLRILERVHLPV